jgi:hypothetical protein
MAPERWLGLAGVVIANPDVPSGVTRPRVHHRSDSTWSRAALWEFGFPFFGAKGPSPRTIRSEEGTRRVEEGPSR